MLGFELMSLPAAFVLANTLSCEPITTPIANVVIKSKPVHHDNGKSISDLQQLFTGGKSVFNQQHITIAGLHRSRIPRQYEMGFKVSTAGGQSCLHLTDITMTINHEATIYIAEEFLDDRCQYKTVLKHELQHEKIDQQIIRKYKHDFYLAIRQFAMKNSVYGPFPAEEREEKKQEFMQMLGKSLEPVVKEWWNELGQRQAEIDTPKEYQRLSDKCKNKKSYQKRQERYD